MDLEHFSSRRCDQFWVKLTWNEGRGKLKQINRSDLMYVWEKICTWNIRKLLLIFGLEEICCIVREGTIDKFHLNNRALCLCVYTHLHLISYLTVWFLIFYSTSCMLHWNIDICVLVIFSIKVDKCLTNPWLYPWVCFSHFAFLTQVLFRENSSIGFGVRNLLKKEKKEVS